MKNVFDKELPKKNCLYLHGMPNAGKSYIARSLCMLGRYFCEISNSASFTWQMLEFQRVAIIEEPCFTPENVEFFKKLAEGHRTQVQVKGSQDVFIDRTPMIVTTNNHIWQYASGEEGALRTRMFVYDNLKPLSKDVFGKKKLNPKVWLFLMLKYGLYEKSEEKVEEEEDEKELEVLEEVEKRMEEVEKRMEERGEFLGYEEELVSEGESEGSFSCESEVAVGDVIEQHEIVEKHFRMMDEAECQGAQFEKELLEQERILIGESMLLGENVCDQKECTCYINEDPYDRGTSKQSTLWGEHKIGCVYYEYDQESEEGDGSDLRGDGGERISGEERNVEGDGDGDGRQFDQRIAEKDASELDGQSRDKETEVDAGKRCQRLQRFEMLRENAYKRSIEEGGERKGRKKDSTVGVEAVSDEEYVGRVAKKRPAYFQSDESDIECTSRCEAKRPCFWHQKCQDAEDVASQFFMEANSFFGKAQQVMEEFRAFQAEFYQFASRCSKFLNDKDE